MRKPKPTPNAPMLNAADLPTIESKPIAQLTAIALELAEDTYRAQCDTIAGAARKLEGIGKDWALNVTSGQWVRQIKPKRKGAK